MFELKNPKWGEWKALVAPADMLPVGVKPPAGHNHSPPRHLLVGLGRPFETDSQLSLIVTALL